MSLHSPILRTRTAHPGTVTTRRRVQPRPVKAIDRLTRYRGGTYSHTVEQVVFTDGSSARTDLIRFNPGIAAYSLDFHGHAPTAPSAYRVDTWSALAHLNRPAQVGLETRVDWILRNSVPQLGTVELSRRVRAAGYRLGTGNITEPEAIAATQAAIWRLTNGLELDTRARTAPVRIVRDAAGVTVEFAEELELGAYTVELLTAGTASVALHKSDDGRSWREVSSSQLTVTAGSHRKALGVGATAGGHRFYRVAVTDADAPVTIGDLDFSAAGTGTGTYRNPERVVLLYRYLLAGAERARGVAPALDAAAATVADGLVGPLRLSVTDDAALDVQGAVAVDADGVELTGPVAPGGVFFLRPDNTATSARVRVTVPGTSGGYGGRVLTAVARDAVSHRLTPVALAVPAALVVDFGVDWSA